MKLFDLTENEKRILRDLSDSNYKEGMFSYLSKEELNVAFNRLQEYGLIKAMYASALKGNILVSANISDEGMVYLKDNPTLENPVDENLIKKLQLDNLEYKKRIRWQEDTIRQYKLVTVVIGVLGIFGWILSFFFYFYF